MKRVLSAIYIFASLTSGAQAEFVGTLKLVPEGCQQATVCELAETFGYIDRRGVGWQADKGDKTDGASIPRWAQRFVGVPYTPQYLKAAVLHDQYSKSVRPVRSWFDTQRMFHEALLDSGVNPVRAAVLYAGVLIGSGKWIIKMKGEPCAIGEACVHFAPEVSIVTESESFGSDAYENKFNKLRAAIEAGNVSDRAKVEALARAEAPDSIFLKHPSGLIHENLEALPWSNDLK